MSTIKPLGKVVKTSRGFQLIEFTDIYGDKCELQASSLAHYEKPGTSAIWLGTADASPKVIWHEAAMVGVKTDVTCGWVPYPLPPQVMVSTRMHLDRKQVASLIKHLQAWLDRNTFKIGGAS